MAEDHNVNSPPGQRDASDLPFRIYRDDIDSLRAARSQLRQADRTLGFVPTMGALHDGHLSLIRAAAADNTHIVVSVFVNPTQFGPSEDLDTYPRTWDEDMAKLTALNKELASANSLGRVTGVFAPSVKTMYPTQPPSSEIHADGSFVTVGSLETKGEGGARPTFFRGVATVCMKLFNIIQPDRVYFGQKDFQQSVVIKTLVRDFHIPTVVHVVPTCREADGLAMSSRNVYLGERRRKVAPILYRALCMARNEYFSGNRSRKEILATFMRCFEQEKVRLRWDKDLEGVHLNLDYILVSHPDDMRDLHGEVDAITGAVISGAAIMPPVDDPRNNQEEAQKPVRLIDNIVLAPTDASKKTLK